jgi:23S rRNA pseudouridine2605 synthase
MIAEGRVKIGETLVTTPATILKDLKGVSVDGKPVAAPEPTRLFAFHKPQGLLTAERDPAGRPTIYTALRNALPAGTPRLVPVGRLDLNTEGLLLLTNDGGLKRTLELPSSKVTRTYRARAFGTVSQAQLEDLIEGVEVDGMRYGRIDANLERRTGRNQWIVLTITEGKNREVRHILEHLGLEVSRLIRVGYGPFALGDLPRGAAAEITGKDLDRFLKSLDHAPSAGVETGQATAKPARDNPKPARAERNRGTEKPDRAESSRGTGKPDRVERKRDTASTSPDRPRRPPTRSGRTDRRK